MKFITCDTNFKDGRETFYEGERRLVDDDKATYFVAHKWAHADGEAPHGDPEPMAEVKIKSHDVVHSTKG